MDIDELRHALADETSGLHIDLPADRIRRRARRVRARRAAMVAAALVVALAVPAGVLAARPDRHVPDRARPAASCADPGIPWVGAPVEVLSGAMFHGVDLHQVLVGVTNTVERPLLTLVFHYEQTGVDEYGMVSVLRRTPDGGFASEDPSDSGRRIASVTVNYGGALTIVVGLYAGLSDRITVTGASPAEVKTVVNRETGWTLFWAAYEPTYTDEAKRIEVLDDAGRVVEWAPRSDSGVWAKPGTTPPAYPGLTATCARPTDGGTPRTTRR